MNAVPAAQAAVGVRALKQNASAVIARAASGESLVITDRGRPVARIVPLEKKSRLQQLIDDGQVAPPRRDPADVIRDLPRVRSQRTVMDVLDELRADPF